MLNPKEDELGIAIKMLHRRNASCYLMNLLYCVICVWLNSHFYILVYEIKMK